MTQTEPRRFQKTVAIKATDEDERTATGAALVPNEVDRQRDFLKPAGIEAMYAPDPDDGVMHYRFADDDAELVRNEIIDEPETIGGKEYAAGSWIITRKYHDDELYQLVQDGVLDGFSIGGEVSQEVDYALDELPEEVTFPAEVEEGPATEIQNGSTGEISDVDIPAVPNADHAEKSLTKNLVERAGDEESFVEMMEPRGHSEEDARRLWGHLQSPTDKAHNHDMTNDTDDPDGASLDDVDDATLGKRLKGLLFGGDDGDGDGDDTDSIELVDADPITTAKALTLAKEGRTLSEANRETLMAAHDAVEAALASDMDFETNRFTDSDEYAFDVAQYGDSEEKALEKLTEEQGQLVANAVQRFVDAQGDATFGEFREWLWQTDALDDDTAFASDEAAWEFVEWTREQRENAAVSEEFIPYVMAESDTDTEITMSKTDDTDTSGDADTDKFANAPEWAEALKEQADKNADRLADLDKTDDGDALEDAPEWAKALHEQSEKNAERIDKVAKASAESDQVDGAEKTSEEDDEASAFKAALGGD
jgi:hypothetical protein